MEKMRFSTEINASAETVWKSLWEESHYRKWTSAFSEGSHAVSDWKENSKILFLDGKGSGMYSRIAKLVPGEKMIFEHLGEIKDGKELPLNKDANSWSGSIETYTLRREGDTTLLEVEMDIVDEFKEYFGKTFPDALALVKQIAENNP